MGVLAPSQRREVVGEGEEVARETARGRGGPRISPPSDRQEQFRSVAKGRLILSPLLGLRRELGRYAARDVVLVMHKAQGRVLTENLEPFIVAVPITTLLNCPLALLSTHVLLIIVLILL